MSEPKILTLDLETSPNVAHVWGLWQQNVSLSQLRESTRVISFAAKWHGKKPVEFRSDFHDGHEAMIQRAWELLDEADIIVGFNHKDFDMRHLKREFVEAGLTPPSPWKDVDLLHVVKRQFRFPSNKLAYVTERLGLTGKLSHSGHDLWVRCLAGDEKAWRVMARYNKQDVVTTEELYDRLLPWIQSHPHRGLYTGEAQSCQRCGGTDLVKRGKAYSPLGVFQQFRCNGCGSWSRGGKRLETVEVRAV